jgi:hypothetical protein
MPALGAGIHVFASRLRKEDVDGRDKPGHDEVVNVRLFGRHIHSQRRRFKPERSPIRLTDRQRNGAIGSGERLGRASVRIGLGHRSRRFANDRNAWVGGGEGKAKAEQDGPERRRSL